MKPQIKNLLSQKLSQICRRDICYGVKYLVLLTHMWLKVDIIGRHQEPYCSCHKKYPEI
jgi:hypothetical protein